MLSFNELVVICRDFGFASGIFVFAITMQALLSVVLFVNLTVSLLAEPLIVELALSRSERLLMQTVVFLFSVFVALLHSAVKPSDIRVALLIEIVFFSLVVEPLFRKAPLRRILMVRLLTLFLLFVSVAPLTKADVLTKTPDCGGTEKTQLPLQIVVLLFAAVMPDANADDDMRRLEVSEH